MANNKPIGVAYEDQKINGGTIDNTVVGGTTPAAVTATIATITTIAHASGGSAGFYGAAAIAQRASAKLSATLSLFGDSGAAFVAGTSSTVSGIWGFNSTMATQLVDALVEIRAFFVALGIHKGGA